MIPKYLIRRILSFATLACLIAGCPKPIENESPPVKRFLCFSDEDPLQHADGLWYFFDRRGVIVEKGAFKDNRHVGVWEIFQEGKLKSSGRYYSGGSLIPFRFSDPPPQVAQDLSGDTGIVFSEDGEPNWDFEAGEGYGLELPSGEAITPDGLWIYYDQNGKVIERTMFDKGIELWSDNESK